MDDLKTSQEPPAVTPAVGSLAMAVQLITLPPGEATVAVMRILARLDAAERQLSAVREIVGGLVDGSKGATPEPWYFTETSHDERPGTREVCDLVNDAYVISRSDLGDWRIDGRLIAATRNAIEPLARALGMEK